MRNSISNRCTASKTTVVAVAIYVMVFLTFFSGVSSSGTMELFISLVIIAIGWNRYKMINTLPLLILVAFIMFMLLLSGKMGERGFNAPIKHALKFVHILFAYECFLFLQHCGKEKERKTFVYVVFAASIATGIHSIMLVMSGNAYAIRYASRYGVDAEGAASFSQIYGMPVLIVAIISILLSGKKMDLWKKASLLLMLIIFSYFVYVSLMTTALILTVAGIGLYLLLEITRKTRLGAVSLTLLFIIVAILAMAVFPEKTMDMVIKATADMNYVLRDRIQYVASKILQIPIDMT